METSVYLLFYVSLRSCQTSLLIFCIMDGSVHLLFVGLSQISINACIYYASTSLSISLQEEPSNHKSWRRFHMCMKACYTFDYLRLTLIKHLLCHHHNHLMIYYHHQYSHLSLILLFRRALDQLVQFVVDHRDRVALRALRLSCCLLRTALEDLIYTCFAKYSEFIFETLKYTV